MGDRRGRFNEYTQYGTPHKFVHNEVFRSRWGTPKEYFVWVCRHCGIVRLEDSIGPYRWFCDDFCKLKHQTGPLRLPDI